MAYTPRTWQSGDLLAAAPLNALEQAAAAAAVTADIGTVGTPTGDAGRAVFVSSAVLAGPGIDPTGGVDSTAAIQAKLDTLAAGGHATLPVGTYLVSSLRVHKQTTLQGQGPLSVLKAAPGALAPVLSLAVDTDSRVVLRDFVIDGNKANQTSAAAGGILLSNQGGAGAWTNIANQSALHEGDPRHLIDSVTVFNTKGAGVSLNGNGATHVRNLQVAYCDGIGLYVNIPDSFFESVDVGVSGLEGIYVLGSNCRFTNCKAWYSGQLDNTHGDGFSIQANRSSLAGCESQDNTRHGYYVAAVYSCGLFAVTADSNGTGTSPGDGIYIDGASDSVIAAQSFVRPSVPVTQRYGINFANGAKRNVAQVTGTGNVTALINDPFQNIWFSPNSVEFGLAAGNGLVPIYSGSRTAADPALLSFCGGRGQMGWSGTDQAMLISGGGSNRDLIFKGASEIGRWNNTGLTIKNVPADPATPTSGGILYVLGGALKYKGSSGTVTTIAPA